MRRFIIIALAVLLVSTAAVADTVFVLCQPNSYVNLRQHPRKGAELAGYAELGDELETDGVKRNGFLHVLGLDADAWINAGFVTEYPVTVETVFAQVESNGRVACRRAINGTRRKWLVNGTELTIYAYADDWTITNKGFIKTQYLGGFYGK